MVGIISQSGKETAYVTHFVLDTDEDVEALTSYECAPGSDAICPSTGSIFMKDSTGTWYPL
jgi:hypothetical protein